MSQLPMKLTALATGCVVLGAGAGTLLSASAAPKATTTKAAAAKEPHGKAGAAKLLRRAVHADLTVATKDGFKTVTIDRGTLTGVSGNILTISESTKKLTGKSVTVTVPAGAKVRLNRQAATLADLKPGQRVAVAQLPKRTVVRAFDKK